MTETKITAQEIANHLNAAGKTYYNDRARGWEGKGFSRIYFGREFVTIEGNGEVHARKSATGTAKTIGVSAVEMVEAAIAEIKAKV